LTRKTQSREKGGWQSKVCRITFSPVAHDLAHIQQENEEEEKQQHFALTL